MADDLRVVMTTFPGREPAEAAARLLADAGLAVCAQVGADLVSFYRWQGTLERAEEVAVVFKVLPARYELFVGELKLQHPFDVPQVVAWSADHVDAAYLAWARDESGAPDA